MIDYEAKIGLFFACTEVLEPLLAYQLVKTFVYAIVFARVVTLQFLIPRFNGSHLGLNNCQNFLRENPGGHR